MEPIEIDGLNQEKQSKAKRLSWIWSALLLGVLLLGAAFRIVGMDWDQNKHLHPDERFLTMVSSSISMPEKWSDYFKTDVSSLNPNNRGYTFYVYGTLPLVIVRSVAEAIDQTGYSQIYLVGRYLSALADLLTTLLVFLIARRLYKKDGLSVLAAAFSAFSVLNIQLSHFFTVDTFANLFIFLAFYFAVHILTEPDEITILKGSGGSRSSWGWLVGYRKSLTLCLFFGIALGMAMASKVSAAPTALLLPAVLLMQFSKTPEEDRDRVVLVYLRNLAAAALVSILVFRICQPYAFNGPGFFNFSLNQHWISSLKDLSQQSQGNVDFPPALQWARRPVTFAWKNMVVWGLGLPLGVAAWAGFVWMAWRMIKGEWRSHALLWGWTALYFTWQSLNFSRSMRYQLPVYPTLAIIAAWALFSLWEKSAGRRTSPGEKKNRNFLKAISIIIATFTLVGTAVWAYAFTRIYTRPVTRLAASEWIYQNIPSAINLHINPEEGGFFNLTLPFRSIASLTSGRPVILSFSPEKSGTAQELVIGHIVDPLLSATQKNIQVKISSDANGSDRLTGGTLSGDFTRTDDPRGVEYKIPFDRPARIEAGQTLYLILELDSETPLKLAGGLSLGIQTEDGAIYQALPDIVETLKKGEDFILSFNGYRNGTASEVFLPHVVDWENQPGEKLLQLTITGNGFSQTSRLVSNFSTGNDPRGDGYSFTFEPALKIDAGTTYTLRLEMLDGDGAIALYGTRHAIESSWDDPLPYALEGYNDPFDYNLGVYRSDLNFEMYWDDNAEKLQRFESVLDRADVIYISSNRQWGTTTRVPERYPLTTEYYRDLMGCPPEKDIFWCYSVAKPGMFKGKLGFDLVQVFQSEPNLGSLTFNSQFAEEAFSVYDHPKVLIFKKNADYDPQVVRDLLGSVDLSKVVHLTPAEAGNYHGNLMLPENRLAGQRSGGTWSELFNRMNVINRYPFAGLILWYVTIMLLGWMVYPMVRFVFRGLNDHGYPAARLFAVILLGYLVWLGGSLGIPVTRRMITAGVLILLAANLLLAYRQKEELHQEWRERKKYFLAVEIITLLLFASFILIRIGNPDLWHPYKGGEKPMDFSYFNAVLKSTTFPPYDPWFAGGYLNYYYYGFVLAGVPVKWLGIIPSIAYNLVLATWFVFLGMGAFSAGWNLTAGFLKGNAGEENQKRRREDPILTGYAAGIVSTVMVLILGNLGTVRMIWQGFQKMVAPAGNIEDAHFFEHLGWAISGIVRFIGGQSLPYGAGDWYWIPSRVIPGEPITEFPFFTFLYADPHAHLFSLPITVLCLLWIFSFITISRDGSFLEGRWFWVKWAAVLAAGGLLIGALRPTSTWDFPTYLALGAIGVVYAVLTSTLKVKIFRNDSTGLITKSVKAAVSAGTLAFLAFIFYQPFAHWYGQAYNAIEIWKGDRTPIQSYLTHWGLFLFILFSWFAWESRDWMKKTPASSLKKLRPYQVLIQTVLIFLAGIGIALIFWGVKITWIALPMAAWAAVLLLRPGQPWEKRAALFMIGTALALTLLVEVTTLKGDIGRMNWVFKFYLQAWILLSLSAATALFWIRSTMPVDWRPEVQKTWQVVLILVFLGAALFPLLASKDKITDRMADNAPHGLDGMSYMAFATYQQEGKEMQLAEDYRAIQWIQDHVQGSPVIVEANTPEYQWGSRFTIYTGLPGVVGWNWHQRQQRAIDPQEWVTERIQEISGFYSTLDQKQALRFLRKYDVSYIIVGQLEKAVYPAAGLAKFKDWEGKFWTEVYHDGETSIYQVIR